MLYAILYALPSPKGTPNYNITTTQIRLQLQQIDYTNKQRQLRRDRNSTVKDGVGIEPVFFSIFKIIHLGGELHVALSWF